MATCEVQAYIYAAKQQMAYAMMLTGHQIEGWRLLQEANALRRRFNDRFWMPDERYIALALDGNKRQVKSIASNAGHCLASGVVAAQHAGDVAAGRYPARAPAV